MKRLISRNVRVTYDEKRKVFGFECDTFFDGDDHPSFGMGVTGRWPTAGQAALWGEAACEEANRTGVFPNLLDTVVSEPIQMKSKGRK